MINLFNINNYTIDTSVFNNQLNGSTVEEFEQNFANYVGAKYACSFNSASSAIFLLLKDKKEIISIPSIIPPVVPMAIINGNNYIHYTENTYWVGDSYKLYENENGKIIDSAQKVEPNQFNIEADDNDLMIFSFYPTKPVGSIDGGMVVSNNKDKIDHLKRLVLNGTDRNDNSWEKNIYFSGWKMYMNSFQAYIANENLKKLPEKRNKLKKIMDYYNDKLYINNNSYHLYRINVRDNISFINKMKEFDIFCGIHYKAAHLNPKLNTHPIQQLTHSEKESRTTVSISFNENLTDNEIEYVIDKVKKYS